MRSATAPTGAAILLTLALAGSSPEAFALGFGRNANNSHLGQALDFSVLMRFDGGEFVASECVVAEVFAGEDKVAPGNVRVTIDPPRESGERLLHVRTSSLIEEPTVSVNLSVGCPAVMTRNFVAFIDPPTMNLAQAAPTEAAPVPTPPAASAVAAPRRDDTAVRIARPSAPPTPPARQVASAAEPASAPPKRPRPARTAVRPSSQDLALAAPRPAPTRPPSRSGETPTKSAAAVGGGGPRLQLEAPPALPPVAAASAARPLAAASAASAGSASSTNPPIAVAMPASGAASAIAAQAAAALAATLPASQVAAAQQAEAQARMRALEDSLTKLRTETEATRGTVATLQRKLQEAEAARDSNGPLTNWLLALVAFLLLALAGVIIWMRRRELQREAWWAAATEQQSTAARHPEGAIGASAIVPSEFGANDAPASTPLPTLPPTQIPTVILEPPAAAESTSPVVWKPTHAIPELHTQDAPRRPVSAEELIDLEQQAEFFVTLGQDDAAIDLLVSHIDSAGGISPLPYLKLMEIHRRVGNRIAYERVRDDFNPRFNAYAPDWDVTDPPTHSLEDHVDVMAQLQEAWSTPPRAMGVLELLLLRRGSDGPVFDLDAYREVLFLFEIARDLAGHVDQRLMVVDFELPLGLAPVNEMLITPNLRSTAPMAPKPEVMRPMHVDLDLDLGA